MNLRLVTVTLAQANAFVARLHRHHDSVVGHKFSVGAWSLSAGALCGVAIVSRPVARRIDHRRTLEVTRLCTDGTRNACSALYGAAARAAGALGYESIITYTLESEGGASLRASGWSVDGDSPGRSWSCPSRPRAHEAQVLGAKTRWLKQLAPSGGPVVPDDKSDTEATTISLFPEASNG